MRVVLFLSSLLVTLASITNCNPSSVFTINSLGFWPDPAISNANSTVSYDFTVPAVITGGTCKYSFTLNGIPFPATTDDLCTQVVCPIEPGRYNQSTSSTFPTISGKVIVKTQWYDQDGNNLLCTQITTKSS